jgi:hypothetical protein
MPSDIMGYQVHFFLPSRHSPQIKVSIVEKRTGVYLDPKRQSATRKIQFAMISSPDLFDYLMKIAGQTKRGEELISEFMATETKDLGLVMSKKEVLGLFDVQLEYWKRRVL